MGVVYKITCLPTGKSYVGKTNVELDKRIKEHRGKSSKCRFLSNVLQEYGWDNNFKVETLYECDDDDLLNLMERKLIEENNTLSPNGYNMKEGGGKGEKCCEELRKIMCETQQENTLKKNGVLGIILENISKDGSTISWSLRVCRKGETHTIANCETREEILRIQQEYTKDPNCYDIPESKRVGNGKSNGVFFNKKRNIWTTNVNNKYFRNIYNKGGSLR